MTAGDGATRWRALATEAEERLAAAGFDSPGSDARRLVEEASGYEGAEYALALDQPVSGRAGAYFDRMLERRLGGEPLQYVLGRWGFRRLDLLVDRRVLVPRPETEGVVEVALRELDRLPDPAGRPRRALDVGTGSGAIALSLAFERPAVEVWALDVSADALEVARANLAGLGRAGTRVRLLEGSWYEPVPAELVGTVDVVVSNPPYVAAGDPLPAEVSGWEPMGALVAGPRGTEALAEVVRGAPGALARPGSLVVELAPWQVDEVSALAVGAGFDEVGVEEDLAGRERALWARLRP